MLIYFSWKDVKMAVFVTHQAQAAYVYAHQDSLVNFVLPVLNHQIHAKTIRKKQYR